MKRSLGEIAKGWSNDEVMAEFKGEMARIMAYEQGKLSDDIWKAKAEAKKKESMPLRFLRRTRHWTDGGIIGTKAFVQEAACQFDDMKKVLKKQLSSGSDENGNVLLCFKRLRKS